MNGALAQTAGVLLTELDCRSAAMPRLVFSAQARRVALEAPPEGFAGFAERYFPPDFMVQDDGVSPAATFAFLDRPKLAARLVRLVEPDAQRTLPSGHVVFRGSQDAAGELLDVLCVVRPPRRRMLMLARCGSTARNILVMRTIRSWHHYMLLEDGFVPLHAAACELGDGEAALIIGEKFAGKTTTLLQLVEGLGCAFVSNDVVYLRADEGALTVTSLPQKVSIRARSARTCRRLQRGLFLLGDTVYSLAPMRRVLRRPELPGDDDPVRAYLTPNEFTGVMGVSSRLTSRVRLILSPSYDEGVERATLQRLHGEEAHARVAANHLPCHEHHDPHWRLLFGPTAESERRRVEAVAQTAAEQGMVHRLRQGARTRRQAVTLVYELASTGSLPAGPDNGARPG